MKAAVAVVSGLMFAASGVLAAQMTSARQQAVVHCGAAPVVARDAQPDIFNDQQEIWLGNLEADMLEAEVEPVRDAALSARLQAIAARLAAVLPPTNIKFRVMLIESDDVDGFSIAGGHIYITRKLAAVANSDDELASVIGHEMGHIISHQFAFEMTAEMKRLTKVTSLGDEANVAAKYNALLDAEYRDKHPQLKESDRETEADRIGLYAMAAAGYRPLAFAEFWNRVFFVQGKTGNRLEDLLGMTKPSEKRLRSMKAMIAALPPDCGRGPSPDERGFAMWHQAVVADHKRLVTAQSNAEAQVTLSPPLHMDLDQLRFSPDGKSILAQDASSIFVLSRNPLAVGYRIDAPEALPANFSPDSQSITFTTQGLHTEQWSATANKLLAAHEVLPHTPCYDPRLSPDGRTLICVELDPDSLTLGLQMLDTASSQVVWEKKSWASVAPNALFTMLVSKWTDANSSTLMSGYSADNDTLLFGSGPLKLAFNLKDRTLIKIGSGVRDTISGEYAFLGNDKIFGINAMDHKSSGVFSFPQGKLIKKIPIPFVSVRSVSNPGTNLHILTFGLKDYGVGLADLSTDRFTMALKTYAMDEDDGTVIGDTGTGQVALAQVGNAVPTRQQHVDLPLSPLPFSPVAALSPDGKYLALSTRHFGGVWDLSTGKRLKLVHGFTDASWTSDDTLYLDISKLTEAARHVGRISMPSAVTQDMPYKVDEETHMRYGRLTDWKLDNKKKDWALSMRDPGTGNVVWARNFPEHYFSYTASYGDRDLIFNFDLKSNTAKDELKANPALSAQAGAVKDKKSARLIQVVDGSTGAQDGELVVDLPPNFAGTDGLNRAGDLLYVQGVDDRTAVYSISTGKMVRQLIGSVLAVDPGTGRVCTVNRIGEAMVYDTAGTQLAHYQLGDPIRYVLFRDNARALTILTADQTVRTMSLHAASTAGVTAASTVAAQSRP